MMSCSRKAQNGVRVAEVPEGHSTEGRQAKAGGTVLDEAAANKNMIHLP
jgi:hypothetical protein